MSNVQERKWQVVSDPAKVEKLLKEKVKNPTFFLKKSDPPAEFYKSPEREDNLFEFHYSPDLIIEDVFTLYSTLNRQLEVDFKKIELPEEGTVYASPIKARVSQIQRKEKRFVLEKNSVSAAHFQVSKSELAKDHTKSQVANKVVYAEFERSLGKIIPGLKIYEYADKNRPLETTFLNRESTALFVEDLLNDGDYKAKHPDTLDYYEILDEEGMLESKKKEYKDQQLQSLVVKPILQEMANGQKKPIAFFFTTTKRGEILGPSVLNTLNEASHEIIHRIMDANLLNIDDRQNVLDISAKGVLLSITHPDLIKYIPNSRVITFDLIFKMQAPLRFRGIVRHLKKVGDEMIVGISLEGTGHRDSVGKKSALSRLESLISHIKEA